jgi:hypothetical protein
MLWFIALVLFEEMGLMQLDSTCMLYGNIAILAGILIGLAKAWDSNRGSRKDSQPPRPKPIAMPVPDQKPKPRIAA